MAALTEDGHKYTEYISHTQDLLQANGITFVVNRKFPRDREKASMSKVRHVPVSVLIEVSLAFQNSGPHNNHTCALLFIIHSHPIMSH